jgi:hypothetical protein
VENYNVITSSHCAIIDAAVDEEGISASIHSSKNEQKQIIPPDRDHRSFHRQCSEVTNT